MKITNIWKLSVLLFLTFAGLQPNLALGQGQTGNTYNPVIGSGDNAESNTATMNLTLYDANAENAASADNGGSLQVMLDNDGKAKINVSGWVDYSSPDSSVAPGSFTWNWTLTGGTSDQSGSFTCSGEPFDSNFSTLELALPEDNVCSASYKFEITGSYSGGTPDSGKVATIDISIKCPSGDGSESGSIKSTFEVGSGGCCGESIASMWLYWNKEPSANVVSRGYLAVSGLSNLKELIVDNDEDGNPPAKNKRKWIRQVISKAVLIDIDDLNSEELHGYTLKYYLPSQIGSKNGLVYSLSGEPFRTVTVANPKTTEFPQGNINRVLITRQETGAVSSLVEEYFWDATAKDWSLKKGDSVTTKLSVTHPNSDIRIVRREVSVDGAVGTASVTESTYQTFRFGERLVKEVTYPGADLPSLITAWEYYTGSIGAYSVARQGNLKSMRRYNGNFEGYWECYEYDPTNGQRIKTVSQYNNSAFGDEAHSKVVENRYGSVALGEPEQTEITKICGVEIGRRTLNRVDGAASITNSSAFGNQVAQIQRVSISGGFFGRVARQVNPDNTATVYGYASTDDDGQVIDQYSGTPSTSGTSITDGVWTHTTKNKDGQIIEEVETDIASSAELKRSSVAPENIDPRGRPTQIDYSDGTSVTKVYNCCGLERETDREGIPTTYEYDALKRQTAKTRLGVRDSTEYDAADRITARKRTDANGREITLEQTVYDNASRVTQITDALGNVTTMSYAYSSAGTTVTTTYPNGGTRIETTSGDGKLKEVAGSAVAHVKYDYGAASGGFEWTKEMKVGDQGETTEWTTTYNDVNGRPVKIEYADGSIETKTYNTAGQLVSQTDADNVTTLYAYNAKGELETTCIDVDHDGVIDLGECDRITKTTRSVVEDANHGTVQRTTTGVYAGDNSDTPTVTSEIDTSLDGLKTWQTQFGQTTSSVTVYGADGVKTVTTINPDNTQRIQTYSDGRLANETLLDSTGITTASTSYAYNDPFGRLSSKTDSRTGTTEYTYDDKDRVHKVAAPAISAASGSMDTVTDYDDANNITTVTLPDGTVTTNEYYPNGKLKKTYGSQTYPVEYTYDSQGRMHSMTTHNAAGDNGNTTTWNYSPQRGWLTSKIYADSKGTTYTYTPGGRLQTRTWARGVVTTYGYALGAGACTGDMTSTVYSDDTPAVTFAYNRLGQRTSAVNSVSSISYRYNANLQPDLEATVSTDASGSGFATGLQRQYDTLGRPKGIELMSSNNGFGYAVGYGYDTAGRLSAVTPGTDTPSPTNTFSYGYEPGSTGLIATLTGPAPAGTPVVSVTNTWEPTRNILAAKENKGGGNVVSRYDYAVNAINQRTSVLHSGSAFGPGTAFNIYGYDLLGQLTAANRHTGGTVSAPQNPVDGQQFKFAFDAIGNRQTATAGASSGTTSYTANAVNQYTAIGAATPTYDADGNLYCEGDRPYEWNGGRTYVWDAENRLIFVTDNGHWMIYKYDALGRRVAKYYDNPDYSHSTRSLSYDGWNLIQETGNDGSWSTGEDGSTSLSMSDYIATYTWGQDLSGSLQGAGGVGGLLTRTVYQSALNAEPATTYYTYDGNGNVSELVDATGTTAAHYEYGPFGEPVNLTSSSGAVAWQNPFRFSSKYTDDDTGFVYYGYRYYDSGKGRWINRDPIDEEGGVNLYDFVNDDAVNNFDVLGLAAPGSRSWPSVTKCTELDGLDMSGLQENVRKLNSDFDNANKWANTGLNPGKGKGSQYPQSAIDYQRQRAFEKSIDYLQQGQAGCANAKALLDMIDKCCGPFTAQQKAVFEAVRAAVRARCNGGSGPGVPATPPITVPPPVTPPVTIRIRYIEWNGIPLFPTSVSW